MRFIKMHGIGNDYIYVDCINQQPPRDPVALARAISDRHFGVGSDGLILICPSERADARMRMFNADGSESEMCGNGIRCVAKFVHDHGIATKPRLAIETGRGVLSLDLEVKDGKAVRVRVNMGEPILEAERIPTTLPGPRVVPGEPLPDEHRADHLSPRRAPRREGRADAGRVRRRQPDGQGQCRQRAHQRDASSSERPTAWRRSFTSQPSSRIRWSM